MRLKHPLNPCLIHGLAALITTIIVGSASLLLQTFLMQMGRSFLFSLLFNFIDLGFLNYGFGTITVYGFRRLNRFLSTEAKNRIHPLVFLLVPLAVILISSFLGGALLALIYYGDADPFFLYDAEGVNWPMLVSITIDQLALFVLYRLDGIDLNRFPSIEFNLYTYRQSLWLFGSAILSIFTPQLSGWTDIAFPDLSEVTIWIYLFWIVWASGVICFLLITLGKGIVKKWPGRQKLALLGMIATILLVWRITHPASIFGVDERVHFFSVGAWTRILLASGPQAMIDDSRLLMNQPVDDEGDVPYDLWPASLQRTGAYWAHKDERNGAIVLYLPRPYYFDSDQFGYIIQGSGDARASLNQEALVRYWEITNGLLFFEDE